jgi:hypothetical protein
MLPFGNMTVVSAKSFLEASGNCEFALIHRLIYLLVLKYLKLPRWFDDWNNIPAENDDDEPEVKAL